LQLRGSDENNIVRNSAGDKGGGWGAQTKEVFPKHVVDVYTKASKQNESLV